MKVFYNKNGTLNKVEGDSIFSQSSNINVLQIKIDYPETSALQTKFLIPDGLGGVVAVEPLIMVLKPDYTDGGYMWEALIGAEYLDTAGKAYLSVRVLNEVETVIKTTRLVQFDIEPSGDYEATPITPEQADQILLILNQKADWVDTENLPSYIVYEADGFKSDGFFKNFDNGSETGLLRVHRELDTVGDVGVQFEYLYNDNGIFKRTITYTISTSTVTNVSEWTTSDGGVTTFTGLLDTPDIYTGKAGIPSSIKDTEDGLDFSGNIKLNSIKFNPQDPEPTYEENKVFLNNYNQLTQMLSTDVRLNFGFETLAKVYNNTGSTITNGTVLTPDGEIEVSGKTYINSIPADARYKNLSTPIAMATEDIENASIGYVTKSGLVRDVDTSAWTGLSSKKVYLGQNGLITPTRPTDGHFPVIVGEVIKIDATNGIIEVNPNTSELTPEVTNINGFPESERFNFNIVPDDATRKITLSKVSDYHFYQYGEKFEITENKEIIISDVEGRHAIYYDNGELTEAVNPTRAQFKDIIINKVWVTATYWNATDSQFEFVLDERHGLMDVETHYQQHISTGTVYLDGMAPALTSVGDVTPTADSTKFAITSGANLDEDIEHSITEKLETDAIKEWYFSGTGVLRTASEVADGISTTGTGRLAYNYFNSSSYSIAEVDSNNYAFRHILAIPNVDKTAPNYVSVMGFNQYSDKNSASAGIESERATLRSLLPTPEFTHVASFLYQTKDSYTGNPYKSRLALTSDGDDF